MRLLRVGRLFRVVRIIRVVQPQDCLLLVATYHLMCPACAASTLQVLHGLRT